MDVHYIEFYIPSASPFEAPAFTLRKVEQRDIAPIVDIPEGSIAFKFFTRTEVEINGEVLTGENRNESKPHVYGKLVDKAWFVGRPGVEHIPERMEKEGVTHLIAMSNGDFMPYNEDEHVVVESPAGLIVPA